MKRWSFRLLLFASATALAARPAPAGVRTVTVALVPYDAPITQDLVADPYSLGTQVTTLEQLLPGGQVFLGVWVTTDWSDGLTGAGLDVYYQPDVFATSTAQVDLNPAWGTLAYCPVSEECVPVPGLVDDVGGNHLTGFGIPTGGMWARLATIELDVLGIPEFCATFAAGQDGPMLFAYFGGGLALPSEITWNQWQIPGVIFEDADGDLAADCLDNCVLPNPNQSDCDDDGQGDVCAVTDGAPDCNENLVPDDCDIADGTSDDADGDGYPDECAICDELSDCADTDRDGIRDNGCLWWSCVDNLCQGVEGLAGQGTAITYADLGGSNGACPPDGTADANDRFHALNCFSNLSTIPGVPYPCEPQPPQALNVDAARLGAPCLPDGVCDANDAFAALNAFSGSTTCTCPPGGPAPAAGSAERPVGVETPFVAAATALTLRPDGARLRPGDILDVDVFFDDALPDLRGYQLHLAVGGGRRGTLELIDIAIRPRKDWLFAGQAPWMAFNTATAQALAGLDGSGLPTGPGQYAATFTYRVAAEAAGRFVIDVRHDLTDQEQRTFLFPTPEGTVIGVVSTTPAVVEVLPWRASRGSGR